MGVRYMRLSWRGLVRWPRIFHFRILSPQAWLYQEELGASGSANGHIKIQPWGPRLKRSVSTLPASRVNLTYHGEEREVRPWPTSNQDSNHEEWEAVLADAVEEIEKVHRAVDSDLLTRNSF